MVGMAGAETSFARAVALLHRCGARTVTSSHTRAGAVAFHFHWRNSEDPFLPTYHTRNRHVACRIGISTEPQSRIDYWKRQEGHTHSRILARNPTYNAAQARESREAAKRRCRSAPGGDPGSNRKRRVWSTHTLEFSPFDRTNTPVSGRNGNLPPQSDRERPQFEESRIRFDDWSCKFWTSSWRMRHFIQVLQHTIGMARKCLRLCTGTAGLAVRSREVETGAFRKLQCSLHGLGQRGRRIFPRDSHFRSSSNACPAVLIVHMDGREFARSGPSLSVRSRLPGLARVGQRFWPERSVPEAGLGTHFMMCSATPTVSPRWLTAWSSARLRLRSASTERTV